MEGEAISATIEVLVQNLINVSRDEISLIRSLDENAEKLRRSFGMIQSFLDDAQTKSVTDVAVKTWVKELQQKAFEADNALDELNYQRILNEKIASCFPSFYLCVHRRDVALRINQINTSFDSINKTAAELGLQQKLASAAPAAAASETDSVTVDPIFIGRDDDVLKIVEMLTTPAGEAVFILPIVGMGGLGKTTLARNVFNHHKIMTHFGQRIWVHVSQDFDAVALLKKILRNVKGGNVEDESREALLKKIQEAEEAKNDDAVLVLKKKLSNLEGGKKVGDESKEVVLNKIQEALKAKTYLLVLDDVWNEDRQKWEDFHRSWSGITSTNRNGILVTTRNTGVGELVKTLDMHHLNGLSQEECWSIIKDRAFEGGSITPGVEYIGRNIAEKCKSLPLAANVVGGIVRGKSQNEWSSIDENWLSGVGGDENYISKILKLSFHNLPSPSLKKCFAYFSIFPKCARIDREQLIQLWMAEGFLQPSQTRDMETIGSQFLKVLLHNSLLQVANRDEYGDVKHCGMHDLVHDVAGSVSDDTYYKRDESRRIPKVKAKWLRTLIYNDKISDIVFSDFKNLHSLTLADDDIKKLPDSIKELIHLRYLDISGTRIRYLPNSIGKLSHLQTIRCLRRSGLKKLPSTVKHLLNLRHLYLEDDYTILPPHLRMLTSLQTLPCFKVLNKEGHRIVELGSLKNLKGELKIYNLENVQGEEESKKASLFQKSGIMRLVLRWHKDRIGVVINDENVLNGLQPHPNIKMLGIDGFKGASFPSWTSKMGVCLQDRWVGLNNLMEIKLEHCSECEEVPTLGHLPNLKFLSLSYMEKVQSIGASFYGIEECSSSNGVYQETITVFPALERLKFWHMQNLREWEEVRIPSGAQVKVFPCLEYLSIESCPQLGSAPSQFRTLKELEIVGMDSELPLASICGIKLKTLTELRIGGIKGLISLPDWLFHNNQHLSKLDIDSCHELRELPDGLHSLNSLEELRLWGCNNLESIPYSSSSNKLQVLTSLRRLIIFNCSGVANHFGEMDESCAPLLEYLRIDAYGSDEWDSVSFNKAVDGVLQFRSHTIRTLHLGGKKEWERLPDQIQHLPALVSLYVSEFGIEELPEWIGNLSSLSQLEVHFCRKLKRLPSVEAMRRLINLTALFVSECPILLESRGIEKQSEWPKISHIPNITVDTRCIQST